MASLALLCLACRAAGSTDASEARRLSKEDHRTFRGKLDPPNNGRGRHHVFVHIPKAAGGSWMRASPNWMSTKDTLTGSHEKNAFSAVTLGQLKKGPPGAVPGTLKRPPDYCACGSTAAFPPMTRTHAHDWYQSDAAFLEPGLREAVRKLVPRDLILYLHGLHLLEETSNKCERATGMRVLCPAKRDRMWAAALKDACAVHNDGGEAYNHTCTYTV